jgi:hypothetical protein
MKAYGDLDTIIGEDEGRVGGSELGGRHVGYVLGWVRLLEMRCLARSGVVKGFFSSGDMWYEVVSRISAWNFGCEEAAEAWR